MGLRVEISEWKPAPFAVGGESIFAVGDVHGCAVHLAALLDCFGAIETPAAMPRRLVYLGDIIDRGPENLGALALWAGSAPGGHFARIDRIMGNHEIMMLMAMAGGPDAAKAERMWLAEGTGGSKVLEEMRAASRQPQARIGNALASATLGDRVVRCLLAQRSHLRIGNTLFVHAGLDGRVAVDEFLAPPWTAFEAARWAWITRGFLDWRAGFAGTLAVHGHTPPAKHWPLTQMDDPHLFLFDRLGLDGGSALTGVVTAAQIEEGRYRIFKAGSVA